MSVVGWALIAVGLLEPVIGYLLVAPRLPEGSQQRTIIVVGMATSGVLMILLGIAFLLGVLGASGPPA